MNLQRALALAARGYAVYPIRPGDKAPLLKGGVNVASYDPAIVEELWREAGCDAEIGVAPARCRRPLVILDIDRKGEVDGLTALRSLDPLLADLVDEDFVFQRTPSGGVHIAFLADREYRSTVGVLGTGLDTRGTGGGIKLYVDNPPDLDSLPPAPAWMGRVARTEWQAPGAEAIAITPSAALKTAINYLKKHAPIAIQGRGGNNTLYQVACQLKNIGVASPEEAEDLIAEHWNSRCQPPWAEEEWWQVTKTVRSAWAHSQDGVRVDRYTMLAKAVEKAERATEQARPARFKVYEADEFVSMPPPRMLVKDVLVDGSMAMIVGPYGAYKSFVALDLALSLATGRPFLNNLTWPCETRRVLYAASEGLADMSARFRCWLRHKKETPRNISFLATPPQIAAMIADPTYFRDFEQLVSNYDVLVLDTLARSAVGIDENDNAQMHAAVETLAKLQADRIEPLTIILVHHTGKAGGSPRGASALGAAVDTIVNVEKNDLGEIELTSTKQKMLRAWNVPQIIEPILVDDPFWPSLVVEWRREGDNLPSKKALEKKAALKDKADQMARLDKDAEILAAHIKNEKRNLDTGVLEAHLFMKHMAYKIGCALSELSPNDVLTDGHLYLKRWEQALKRLVDLRGADPDGRVHLAPGVWYRDGCVHVG